ncbi:MAG: restriction endonuclease subunit S [Xanthomonadales bacterium]|jgi:type I restriction enzyme S subunit|nr:restriction endonuclease subunit S [Xanthomonadales bacterium]
MSAGLLEHFERLAEAPSAIPRLRRLVLDLAVRGKLVAQDPAEEPAKVQLAILQAERNRLHQHESLRDRKPVTLATRDRLQFDFPINWELVIFDQVFSIVSGVAKGGKQLDKDSVEAPYLRVANVQRGYLDLDVIKTLKVSRFDFERYRLKHDDILMTEGGDWDKLGRAAIWQCQVPDCIHQNHVFRVRPPSSDISPRWVVIYVNSQIGRRYFENAAKQTTNLASINMTQLRACPLPLPPLAEQHRIVAKVDELMGLLDRIEAAQAAREATRQQLATASLARLTSATDDTDFQTSADFVLQTLPTHTTRREQIKQLRQTILNLAVRGRLGTGMGEAGSDERASTSHELPPRWRFLALGDLLAEDTRNGYSRRPDDAEDGIPILRISAGTIRPDGVVAEEEHKRISGIDDNTRKQYGLKKGDLLACRFNGNKFFVGRLTIFQDYLSLDPIYPDKLIRVRLNPQIALPEFIRMAGDSDIVRSSIEQSCATTVGNWGISASNLKEIHFPLPPLAEQHRIVAKVNELMTLCDRLDTALAQAEAARARLLDAELHAAVHAAEAA